MKEAIASAPKKTKPLLAEGLQRGQPAAMHVELMVFYQTTFNH
jgi:hypothetical protein